MSTKIYYARRLPIRLLNDFLDDVRGQVLRMINKRVITAMATVEIGDWSCPRSLNPWMSEQHRRFECVSKLVKKSADSPYRDTLLGLEASLNVWLSGSNAYVIPIMEDCMRSKIRWPRSSKDFGYWNNTDRPNGISEREWSMRARAWEGVNLGPDGSTDHNSRRFNHSIFAPKEDIDLIRLWLSDIRPKLEKSELSKQSKASAKKNPKPNLFDTVCDAIAHATPIDLCAVARERQSVKLEALPGEAKSDGHAVLDQLFEAYLGWTTEEHPNHPSYYCRDCHEWGYPRTNIEHKPTGKIVKLVLWHQ